MSLGEFEKARVQPPLRSGVTAVGTIQFDRMGRMNKENEAVLRNAIARDFKTASQEYGFETATAFFEADYSLLWIPEDLEDATASS